VPPLFAACAFPLRLQRFLTKKELLSSNSLPAAVRALSCHIKKAGHTHENEHFLQKYATRQTKKQHMTECELCHILLCHRMIIVSARKKELPPLFGQSSIPQKPI